MGVLEPGPGCAQILREPMRVPQRAVQLGMKDGVSLLEMSELGVGAHLASSEVDLGN